MLCTTLRILGTDIPAATQWVPLCVSSALRQGNCSLLEEAGSSPTEEEAFRLVELYCARESRQELWLVLRRSVANALSAEIERLKCAATGKASSLALHAELWRRTTSGLVLLQRVFYSADATKGVALCRKGHARDDTILGLVLNILRETLKAEPSQLEQAIVDQLRALRNHRAVECVQMPWCSTSHGAEINVASCPEHKPEKDFTDMLVELDLYAQCLEAPYLVDLEKFHHDHCSLDESLSATEVPVDQLAKLLVHIQIHLEDERKRCVQFMHAMTVGKAGRVVRAAFFSLRRASMLASGMDSILKQFFLSDGLPRHNDSRCETRDWCERALGELATAVADPSALAAKNAAAEGSLSAATCLMLLYEHFRELSALSEFNIAFKDSIQRLGEEYLNSRRGAEGEKSVDSSGRSEPAKGTVAFGLICWHARLEKAVKSVLGRDRHLSDIMKDAFEYFLNKDAHLSAFLTAKFVDLLLREGYEALLARFTGDQAPMRGLSCEWSLERLVEAILTFFRALTAKDVFEAFHRKDLAKRLLLQCCADPEEEIRFIERLKQECGPEYTAKMEGMVRDITTSKDLLQRFATAEAVPPHIPSISFSCSVLTRGMWPAYPTNADLRFPSEISALQDSFTSFYLGRHSGRNIQFITTLGQATLRATLRDHARGAVSKHEFCVSLHQAVVLLLFNHRDALRASEIREKTLLETGELTRTLQSLAMHKHVKLLLKDRPGREVLDDDLFSINNKFADKRYHITLNQIQSRETPEEVAAIEEKVCEDRQYQVDAAIVRTMKAAKKQTHSSLTAAVMSHLLFPCSTQDVKKRIESLIEREYLARSENDPSAYEYRA